MGIKITKETLEKIYKDYEANKSKTFNSKPIMSNYRYCQRAKETTKYLNKTKEEQKKENEKKEDKLKKRESKN